MADGVPLTDQEISWLTRDMLKTESERDKQRLIGASSIGNPCDRCLADQLLNRGSKNNKYWLGARIGTAIHSALEEQERLYIEGTEDFHFRALTNARVEQKITLGEIDGYGVITSKPDLVLVNNAHLIDWKTSTKLKMKKYKLNGVSEQYFYQQQLYAWGLNSMGIKIDKISLVFIARDGATDDDIWVYSFDYDEEAALRAWNRLKKMWEWLRAGGDPDDLRSHSDCFVCSMMGRI